MSKTTTLVKRGARSDNPLTRQLAALVETTTGKVGALKTTVTELETTHAASRMPSALMGVGLMGVGAVAEGALAGFGLDEVAGAPVGIIGGVAGVTAGITLKQPWLVCLSGGFAARPLANWAEDMVEKAREKYRKGSEADTDADADTDTDNVREFDRAAGGE